MDPVVLGDPKNSDITAEVKVPKQGASCVVFKGRNRKREMST